MAWMKAYPNDHDPFYLFILINDLIARLPQTPALEVKLCTMLAVKALTTAASAIPPAKVSHPSPSNTISLTSPAT